MEYSQFATGYSDVHRAQQRFNQDIGDWDTSNVLVMDDAFNGATSFDQDLSNWDFTNVLSAIRMFDGITLTYQNYDRMLNAWSQ